jgi:hypothetical protein
VAERLERIRDLEFERVPPVRTITADEAREEGLAALDEEYPPERRAEDEEILTLLGLIPEGSDLRELAGTIFGEEVAGFYDDRTKAMTIVAGAASGTEAEIALAHELTHALEDQRFGLESEPSIDDRTLPRAALHEGSATALMYACVQDRFSAEETLGGLLSSVFQDSGDLPPFIQAQLLFPYVAGERFVSEPLRRAGGRWDLVDTAYELRPPASTEEVLHPAAYFDADEPRPVRLRARTVLGGAWRRAHAGTWGELQTRELLGGASEAAAGWAGDRYELWRSGGAAALLMRWRWDTPRDEAEFAARAREVLGERAVVARRGGRVTLVVAPGRGLAERLAARA